MSITIANNVVVSATTTPDGQVIKIVETHTPTGKPRISVRNTYLHLDSHTTYELVKLLLNGTAIGQQLK